jgi:hypothetical protein
MSNQLNYPSRLKVSSCTWRLLHNKRKWATTNSFIKRSASWSRVDKKDTVIFLFENLIMNIVKINLMCFVYTWKIELKDKYVASILSHQRLWHLSNGKEMVDNREWIHWILVALLDNNLYSDLVLLRATVYCYLQLKKIEFLPWNTQ